MYVPVRWLAVQNERDQIRVRRPSYDEARTARPDGIAIATLHRAELLSREVCQHPTTHCHQCVV